MFNKKMLTWNGFTLIELIVVISIIAVIASFTLVAMNGARIKSRDAKRIADLLAIQSALEQHALGNPSYPYPPEIESAGTDVNYCPDFPGTDYGIYANQCFSHYLSVVPKGPQGEMYNY